jgi:hypothetical protein
VYELEAGIIIPKPELQKRMMRVIASESYANLHNPNYSAVSNPFNSRYQNCTELTLDIIQAAVYQTDDIRQIKTNEMAYFKPQPVNVGPLTMLLSSIFMPDIATADHQGGKIRTATFTTIAAYMQEHGLAAEQLTVAP